ncbi:bifunctional diguanylate cyclase/phosphodiesterase [Roseofilum capinflatum]|uniref:EAL domain-containing protein n=1 Tax=Roseofilum capinflatum BLCC-M114 TaxID=3022440 RepID=A0ABT7BBK0_9CYAN|nr:EAL domain-containing protein [Roseofilum capinflatum]MDJ1176521.1 EAL domain-containing protein [Roseofilum capinflatum BLCC-M114]
MLDPEYHIRLLQGVTQATHCLLTLSDRHEAIHQALAHVGQALAVDRVYIFQNHSDPVTQSLLASQWWEWTPERISLPFNNLELQNLSYTTVLRRWYDYLSQGKPITGYPEELPEWEKQLLGDRQVCSLLVLPIFVDREFWGFIECDDCQTDRLWTAEEIKILTTVADSFGGAIAHHRAQTELNHIQTQLEAAIEERTFKLRAAVKQLQGEINKKEKIATQLRHNAYHDPLTGLGNRALFMEHLQTAIDQAQASEDYKFAILFLDLDRFKVVNDTLGHTLGDLLLIELSQRLNQILQQHTHLAIKQSLIAHLGSDEFAILLAPLSDLSQANQLAETIHQDMNHPFVVDGHEILTTVSIGIAVSSTGYQRPEQVLRDADIVMYHAKSKGRARYEVFDLETHTRVMAQLQLENDLRRAVQFLESPDTLKHNQFIVYYQPITCLKTGLIAGFEALLRWQHPHLGMVSPVQFIPIAEETGLIALLGQWVLEEACLQLRLWESYGHHSLTMAVNLSGCQLSRPDLLEKIDQIIHKSQINADHLKLEITESMIINNAEYVKQVLSQLKQRSIKLCMDDFGTGYSSLSYLHRFPLDILKIDKSFVSNMGEDGEQSDIVRTIINLAHHLNMQVIAEGVETLGQLKILSELGCEWGQGYFFSRPMDGEKALNLLENQE